MRASRAATVSTSFFFKVGITFLVSSRARRYPSQYGLLSKKLSTYLLLQQIFLVLIFVALVILQLVEALSLLLQLTVIGGLLLDKANDRGGCDFKLGARHCVRSVRWSDAVLRAAMCMSCMRDVICISGDSQCQ